MPVPPVEDIFVVQGEGLIYRGQKSLVNAMENGNVVFNENTVISHYRLMNENVAGTLQGFYDQAGGEAFLARTKTALNRAAAAQGLRYYPRADLRRAREPFRRQMLTAMRRFFN